MIKIRNKRIALLLVLAMLATMFVGIGAASAASSNSVVGNVPMITGVGTATLASIAIDENDIGNLASGNVFLVTIIPSGVAWTATAPATITGTQGLVLLQETISPTVQKYTVTALNAARTSAAYVLVPNVVNVSSVGTGDIQVNLAAPNTGIAQGNYTVGTFSSGGAVLSSLSTPAVGSGNHQLGTVRIIENSVSGIATGDTVTLKLPAGITWDSASVVATNGRTVTPSYSSDDQILTLTFGAAVTNTVGIYDVTTNVTISSSDARKGDIIVQTGGTADNVTPSEITIGTFGTFGVEVSVASVKTLLAGKFYQKTDTVTLGETIAASFIPGRSLTIEVPSGVIITDVQQISGPFTLDPQVATTPDSTIDVTVGTSSFSSSPVELKFRLVLSIAATFKGDITATISGAGIDSQSVVVAKAIAPASITSTSTDLQIGLQSQAVSDFVITEAQKGALVKTYQTNATGSTTGGGKISVSLSQGASFAKTPTVTVTSGDMVIDSAGVTLTSSAGFIYDGLTIPIKNESTTASVITISNNSITLDRGVPAGPIVAKLNGRATSENYADGIALKITDPGTFTVATVSSAQFGNVVTPIPGGESNISVFTVGASTFLLNGVVTNNFSAPYIKNNRTFLSIRDMGTALGITQSNILWDEANKSVTLMKGDKVVQVAIGSPIMLINGIAVTMDVAPEYNPAGNRAMLPAAWICNAFGASAVWDATLQTVTINS